MKKIIAFLMTLLLVVTLASCSSSKTKAVTLSFDTDGGSQIAAIEATPGEAIDWPANPTKEGLTFGGWYTDIDLTEALGEELKFMPQSSMTVYAKWVVTLKFDSKGGSDVNDIVAEGGSVFTIPTNPERDGYIFVGWYLDEAFTQRLTYVMPRTNATAYARWQVLEPGSAILLDSEWLVNDDGSYVVTPLADGQRITTTPGKGEWSYVYQLIDGDATSNQTIIAVLKGTANTSAVLKVEGGNAAAAAEISVTFTGEVQEVVWTVEAKNLTSIGGQKFLIFVNGGTAGCSEVAEYVEVYSLGLYRTIEASETPKATLSFIPNGGSEVPAYYLVPGTIISAPQDPVKEGFTFTGWYVDKELTTLYEFTVMPERATVVYAGWVLANEFLDDCDLMGGEFKALDEGTYEITNSVDKYTIKKTEQGGEWNCIVLPMTDKKLGGYNLLRVEIKGQAGDTIMFKINDVNAGERTLTLNGRVQTFELAFDFDLDASRSLVVFVKPGVAGESGEIEITKLAYGNYSKYVNLLVDGWTGLDEGVYSIELTDGLHFSKALEGGEWSCMVLRLEDVKLAGFDTLKAIVKGPEGLQVLLKVNDAVEKWVTCTGEELEVVFEFERDFDLTKPVMVVFAEAGALGTGAEFTIYELALTREAAPTPVEPVEVKDVDLMGLTMSSLGEGEYTVTNEVDKYVLQKTEQGGEWSCVVLPMKGLELTGLHYLKIAIQGVSGEAVLVKINDDGAGERRVELNGEVQVFEFEYAGNLDPSKSLVLFLQPGVAGSSNQVTITELKYLAQPTILPLVGKGFRALDEDLYEVSETAASLVITKKPAGYEWSCVVLDPIAELAGKTIIALSATVQGTNGEQLLIKLNDSKEFMVNLDGTVQTLMFEADYVMDGTKSVMVLFANPGTFGSNHAIEIFDLTLYFETPVMPKEDPAETGSLIGQEIRGLDEGAYVIDNQEDKYIISKNEVGGEWSCAVIDAISSLDGLKVEGLQVTVKGPEGEQLLFKLNDTVEFWVTCTGEVQQLSFECSHTMIAGKHAMVIFANPGIFGTGNSFEITELKLEFAGEVVVADVDLMGLTMSSLGEGEYTVTNEADKYVLQKTEQGGEWSCVVLPMKGLELTGLHYLRVAIQGTEGEAVLFKINDENAGERRVELNGEVQVFELEYAGALDPSKSLVIFLQPGVAGSSNQVTITELAYLVLPTQIELVGKGFIALDDANEVEESAGSLKFKKLTTGAEWNCIALDAISELFDQTVYAVEVIFQGPVDHSLLIKLNDTKEFMQTCTGEVQHIVLEANHVMVAGKRAMVLFADAGQAGTGEEFEVFSLILHLKPLE